MFTLVHTQRKYWKMHPKPLCRSANIGHPRVPGTTLSYRLGTHQGLCLRGNPGDSGEAPRRSEFSTFQAFAVLTFFLTKNFILLCKLRKQQIP